MQIGVRGVCAVVLALTFARKHFADNATAYLLVQGTPTPYHAPAIFWNHLVSACRSSKILSRRNLQAKYSGITV